MVEILGQTPVPVEILPYAYRPVTGALALLGGTSTLRMAIKKDGPVISDNGNFILDVQFEDILQPSQLEEEINNIPGVVENGLFCNMAHEVLVGTPEGLVNLYLD
jgi:ribose 5-phosphate isomerase A